MLTLYCLILEKSSIYDFANGKYNESNNCQQMAKCTNHRNDHSAIVPELTLQNEYLRQKLTNAIYKSCFIVQK